MKSDTAEQHESIARHVAKLILEAHGNVSAHSLFRRVGASETVCRNAFVDFTGESLDEFSRRVRLERAACLLTGSTDPIWEVAANSGYSSNSTLDRSFRSHFGCSPSMFRKLNDGRIEFPSFAYVYGFEPGRERFDIGVYTGFAQITTFTYDAYRLLERQKPDGSRQVYARRGMSICDAILAEQEERI